MFTSSPCCWPSSLSGSQTAHGPRRTRQGLQPSPVPDTHLRRHHSPTKRFMSDEHFTVDGTLIQKSFRSKDGSDDGDGTGFRGQKRSNQTHESTTDPDAALQKELWQRVEVELSGPRTRREPQRIDCRCDGHACRRIRGAGCRTADAQAEAKTPFTTHHSRRRQGVRQQGFCAHGAATECHASCSQERQDPKQQPGSKDYAATRLCNQS